MVERYSAALQKNGGKLMLSGVSAHVYEQLEKTEIIELLVEENIYPEAPGCSTPASMPSKIPTIGLLKTRSMKVDSRILTI